MINGKKGKLGTIKQSRKKTEKKEKQRGK